MAAGQGSAGPAWPRAELSTQVLEDLISTCVASFSPRFDFKAGLRFLFAPLHVSGLLKNNVSEAFKSCSLTNKVLHVNLSPCCLVFYPILCFIALNSHTLNSNQI